MRIVRIFSSIKKIWSYFSCLILWFILTNILISAILKGCFKKIDICAPICLLGLERVFILVINVFIHLSWIIVPCIRGLIDILSVLILSISYQLSISVQNLRHLWNFVNLKPILTARCISFLGITLGWMCQTATGLFRFN